MQIRLPFTNSPHRHLGLPLYTAAMVASHALAWMDGLLAEVASFVAIPIGILGAMLWIVHSRGALCEACGEQTPLNPELLVQRRAAWLRHHHRANATVKRHFCVLAVWVVLLALSAAFGGTSGHLLSDLTITLLLLHFWASEIHGRLTIWCPQCRRGGGWGETAEAPTPSTPQTA